MQITKEQILKGRILDKSSYKDGCWVWKAAKVRSKKATYGQMWDGKKVQLAHRLSYILNVGKIPKGQTIDHECRNTLCVNPKHLRVMTMRDNILCGTSPVARNAVKTHCIRGHKLSGDNLCFYRKGKGPFFRGCRKCYALKSKRYYWKNKTRKGKL